MSLINFELNFVEFLAEGDSVVGRDGSAEVGDDGSADGGAMCRVMCRVCVG